MKYTPYPYQAFAEKFVLEHKAAGLFLDMGLGKTAITLSACEKLLRDYFAEPKGSLYTREAFRCGGVRADEGIGPYNEKIFKLR